MKQELYTLKSKNFSKKCSFLATSAQVVTKHTNSLSHRFSKEYGILEFKINTSFGQEIDRRNIEFYVYFTMRTEKDTPIWTCLSVCLTGFFVGFFWVFIAILCRILQSLTLPPGAKIEATMQHEITRMTSENLVRIKLTQMRLQFRGCRSFFGDPKHDLGRILTTLHRYRKNENS